MQNVLYEREVGAAPAPALKQPDAPSHSAPTEELTARHFRAATLDAAHEAILTVLNRLFYLGQLIDVADQYGYELESVLSAKDLDGPTNALLDLAERIQNHRKAE